MKVFKFGGASVKDASAVKNVSTILKNYAGQNIVVVVSAMGKTTNHLEQLVEAWYFKKGDPHAILNSIKKYHYDLIDELFSDPKASIYSEINNVFVEIEWILEEQAQREYDYEYDQIVSLGELISSKIIHAFLNLKGFEACWLDARDFIQTDNTYREAKINWKLTESLAQKHLIDPFKKTTASKRKIIVTQGFIGSTSENFSTTLGREGSDFTAAIIAYVINAESVTIWKDVPGVLNADPKWFDKTEILEHLSYQDAIELAYYGATVIHPKTIKPLQNKNVPLYVKSFINPSEKGTIINSEEGKTPIPSFIFKINQVLISIIPKDFSFVIEENLRDVFNLLAQMRIKINVMQNTALKFSFCMDYHADKTQELIHQLNKNFSVNYNENLELVTIRYYDQQTIDRVSENKKIFLELKSRNTIQMLMKNQ